MSYLYGRVKVDIRKDGSVHIITRACEFGEHDRCRSTVCDCDCHPHDGRVPLSSRQLMGLPPWKDDEQ